MKRILTYLLVVPILALTACEPRTDDDLATTETDTLAMQQDARMAQAELQSWLDEIDRNMEQLQARVQEAGQTDDVDLEDLRQRRDEVRNEIQGMGTTTDSPTAGIGADIQSRLRDLDADVEEARLNAIEQREEFIAEVRTRLNEIDSDLESLERRTGTTTTSPNAVGMRDGMQDGTDTDRDGALDADNDAMAMNETERDMTLGDGTTTEPGRVYGDAGMADLDVEDLRSDRDEVAEQLNELESGEDTFEDSRDDLAESIAELRARVQEASLDIRNANTGMMPGVGTARNASTSLN